MTPNSGRFGVENRGVEAVTEGSLLRGSKCRRFEGSILGRKISRRFLGDRWVYRRIGPFFALPRHETEGWSDIDTDLHKPPNHAEDCGIMMHHGVQGLVQKSLCEILTETLKLPNIIKYVTVKPVCDRVRAFLSKAIG